MQPLRKEDVFIDVDTSHLHARVWEPESEGCYETFRGLLMAGAIGLPLWAMVIALCWLIWF